MLRSSRNRNKKNGGLLLVTEAEKRAYFMVINSIAIEFEQAQRMELKT